MFATIREGTSDPEKVARGSEQADEFWRLRARQPGYRGSVTIGAENGRVLIVTLWESQPDADAAIAVLEPESQRLMSAVWTVPSREIARGPWSAASSLVSERAVAGA
jgi:hypothetical protein